MRVKDVLARVVTGFHRSVLRASRGRVAGRGLGMPVVMLTTTGRKTGKRRTTVLTAPVHDRAAGTYVLVASYGGDDRHPAWFLNLRDPDVEITVDGATHPIRAHIASREEKAELWPRVTSTYKGYAGYQKRTDRDIPLVILEPR